MKTKLTQKRYKAKYACSCRMCKPWKSNGENKRSFSDLKGAVKHQYEINDLD